MFKESSLPLGSSPLVRRFHQCTGHDLVSVSCGRSVQGGTAYDIRGCTFAPIPRYVRLHCCCTVSAPCTHRIIAAHGPLTNPGPAHK